MRADLPTVAPKLSLAGCVLICACATAPVQTDGFGIIVSGIKKVTGAVSSTVSSTMTYMKGMDGIPKKGSGKSMEVCGIFMAGAGGAAGVATTGMTSTFKKAFDRKFSGHKSVFRQLDKMSVTNGFCDAQAGAGKYNGLNIWDPFKVKNGNTKERIDLLKKTVGPLACDKIILLGHSCGGRSVIATGIEMHADYIIALFPAGLPPGMKDQIRTTPTTAIWSSNDDFVNGNFKQIDGIDAEQFVATKKCTNCRDINIDWGDCGSTGGKVGVCHTGAMLPNIAYDTAIENAYMHLFPAQSPGCTVKLFSATEYEGTVTTVAAASSKDVSLQALSDSGTLSPVVKSIQLVGDSCVSVSLWSQCSGGAAKKYSSSVWSLNDAFSGGVCKVSVHVRASGTGGGGVVGASSGACTMNPSAQEQAFRMWTGTTWTCQRLQAEYQTCTTTTDPNHAKVMQNCPITCAKARGEPCRIAAGGVLTTAAPTSATVTSQRVRCGDHFSNSGCAGCPQGNGAAWCNGACTWSNEQCLRAPATGLCVAKARRRVQRHSQKARAPRGGGGRMVRLEALLHSHSATPRAAVSPQREGGRQRQLFGSVFHGHHRHHRHQPSRNTTKTPTARPTAVPAAPSACGDTKTSGGCGQLTACVWKEVAGPSSN